MRSATALLLLTACTHAPSPAGERPSAILSWEEYARTPHDVPWIVQLQSGSGRLLYFGARHTFEDGDPQVAQIEELWSLFAPTTALNEGGDPPVGATDLDAVRSWGEAGLVRFLAARDGVPVRSLEPPLDAELAALAPHHSIERVKLFYVLRQVPHYRRAESAASLEQRVERDLAWLAAHPALQGEPRSIAEVEALCRRELPDVASWEDVSQDLFDPGQENHFTNDISRRLADLRDRHMVELLCSEVGRGQRVFAVVGASHVVMQEPELRRRLP